MVFGKRRPAAGQEWALVGCLAVRAGGDRGKGPCERRQKRRGPFRDGLDVRPDERGHVLAHEQVREVGVAALSVEVHHLGPRHLQPRPANNVDLDGHVREVLLLHVERRLHLDQGEAAAALLEDVHGDENSVLDEAGLVHDGRSVREDLLRGCDPAVVFVVMEVDQDAPGNVCARQLADPLPPGEDRSLPVVRIEFRGLGLVRRPPEQLRAL
jgi:hypothetical protein